MNNPEFVKIGEKKYKINTDFRVALECERIARDESIEEHERALAIIYKLFGDDGLENFQDWNELLKLGQKYLLCGQKINIDKNEQPDMDFEEDKHYIRSSFIQDYHYNPYELKYLHFWDFYYDLCNLSNSEFGNCCILNRIRNLRNYDLHEIKDRKEREKIEKAKKSVELKRYKKENNLTKEQEESMLRLNEILGMR